MPRPLRIEYAGARYHVMGRGNRGSVIFRENHDRDLFLETLAETVERTGWKIHAWVLMRTHYHFLLETPEPNLVRGMRWFPGTFTQRYNAYHGEYGHLFQGRYKAKIVDDQDPSYFRRVADYIHLNPAAAGLLNSQNPDLSSYAWSSYPNYLAAPSKRPVWLRTDALFSSHGIQRDTVAGRQAFAALMDRQMDEVMAERYRQKWKEQWDRTNRGWVYGTRDFRDRMAAFLAEEHWKDRVPVYDHDQMRSYGEAAAEVALKESWGVVGLDPGELRELKKGDPRKLLLAGWLRAHFSVSRKWISQRLHLGHPSRVQEGVCLYRSPTRQLKRTRKQLDQIIEFSG